MRRLAVVAALAAALTVTAAAPAAPNNNNSTKLRDAVTLAGVRQHQAAWQAIADLSGDHRFAGTPGYELSADYVYDKLQAAGYQPTFWSFDYDAFVEDSVTQLAQVSPNPATYANGVDFRIMSYSGSGNVTAALAQPSGDFRGCRPSDFAGFSAGSIAIVSRGAPADFPEACTFRLKTENAAAAGASAVLVYNNVPGLLSGTLGATGLAAIPSVGLTQALGQSLVALMGSGPVTMHVRTETSARTLTTRNVLAELKGKNDSNVVVVGAHLDSVNAGPGINDNGSGSGAILETAIHMAKVKPENTVRFAWWSAEESGLIGSTRYVNSLSQAELDRIALNLNFDMVGSPNFVRFVYDGDNSAFPVGPGASQGPPGSGAIERLFHDYFAAQGLASAETPFSGRSDYGPFINKGIPAGGLFTGAEGIKTPAEAAIYGGTAGIAYDPCYHLLCDDFDNNSNEALDQMSDAIAHATITLAQSTQLVNGIRGKGNFNSWEQVQKQAGPGGDAGPGGGGTPGGGGLHDHDHDDPADQ